MGVVGATWRRLRSLGRASLLPASACLPAFTRGPLYTTLHPQRPLSNAQICGLRPPSPDSPLFTRRLFQIGQNVKPKDGTQLKYKGGTRQISGLKRAARVGSLTRCYVQGQRGGGEMSQTKTVAAATCCRSGTALRLSCALSLLIFLLFLCQLFFTVSSQPA